jgi:DNA repair ATPase RecN
MERFVRPEKVEIPQVYYDAEIPEVETEVMEEPVAEPEVMAAPEPEIPAEPEISAAWEVEPEVAAEPEQPVEPAAEPKPPVGAAAASAAKAGFKKVQQYTNQARKKVDGAKLKNNLRKIFRKPTRKLSRKGVIALGAAAAAAVAALVILIICLAGNSYKTPVRTMERAANNRTYSFGYDKKLDHLNGLLKKETKELYEILEQSDAYMEMMEEFAEEYEEYVEEMEDEYGKNYKYSYKITEKEELKRKELREFRDYLRAAGELYVALDEETEDYETEDWEDVADMLDLSRSKTKSLVRKIVAMGKELKKADVTEGYELTVEMKLTGKELDEPEEDEVTICVYKVNGRWIAQDGLMSAKAIYTIIGELS